MEEDEYVSDSVSGRKSITRDAVIGQLTQYGLAVGATAALGALNALDLTTVPGWLAGAATLAVTTAAGFLTNYLAKRKK
jgi:hypothetical protein